MCYTVGKGKIRQKKLKLTLYKAMDITQQNGKLSVPNGYKKFDSSAFLRQIEDLKTSGAVRSEDLELLRRHDRSDKK